MHQIDAVHCKILKEKKHTQIFFSSRRNFPECVYVDDAGIAATATLEEQKKKHTNHRWIFPLWRITVISDEFSSLL